MTAYPQAMRAELAEYGKRLTFLDEHPLTTEPLRVDLLIIKKPRNIQITKNIGRMFREHNIIEYKSPDDSLSVDDYYKVFAYSYLYAALEHVSPDDLSVSFITSMHPRNLFRRLRSDPSLAVEEVSRGIHYVHGERMPVQIIEQKALSQADNLWLASLRKDLTKGTLMRVVDESSHRIGDQGAFIFAVLEANEKTIKGDTNMVGIVKRLSENPAFISEFEKLGYININDAEKLGFGNLVESAKRLLQRGDSIEDVAYILGLPLVRIEEIKADLDKDIVS